MRKLHKKNIPKVQKTNFLIFPPEKIVFNIHDIAL